METSQNTTAALNSRTDWAPYPIVGGEDELNESETKRWTKQDFPTPASCENANTTARSSWFRR